MSSQSLATKNKHVSKPARRSVRTSPAAKYLAQPVIKPTRNLPIQTKLTIGQPNDKYEQEADRVADQVMRMSDADVAQRVEAGTVQPMRIQRMCPECEEEMAQRQPMEEEEEMLQPKLNGEFLQRQPMEEEEEMLQPKLNGELLHRQLMEDEEEELQAKEMPGQTPTVAPNLESRINSLKGGGQPLDSATRSFFEPRFGHDFSNVRVHTDSSSADTAKSINARAFTLRNHVVMGAGEYHPKSQSGQRLLGHELTHVVQQGEDGSSNRTQLRGLIKFDPLDIKQKKNVESHHRATQNNVLHAKPQQQTDIRDALGYGEALDQGERKYFEPLMNMNLSNVRVHIGDAASRSAQSMNARAYTRGNDIIFNRGEYNPRSDQSRYTLAHELSHIGQYNPSASNGTISAVESDANCNAKAMLSGQKTNIQANQNGSITWCLEFGQPQNTPEKTYIAGPNPTSDGFLQSAYLYHNDWGLAPTNVTSLNEIVHDLSNDTSTLDRIRIVTHANYDHLFVAMFQGGATGALQPDLNAFGRSGQEGLANTVDTEFSMNDPTSVINDVLTNLRALTITPNPLAAFGLNAAGSTPTGSIREFILRAGTILVLNLHAADPTTSSDDQTAMGHFVTTHNALLDILESQAAAQFSLSSMTEVQALRTAILAVTLNSYPGYSTQIYSTSSTNFDWGINTVAATPQVSSGNFDSERNTVQNRFNTSSWIDIRGCNVGGNSGYMESVGNFFGDAASRPHVSAPDWYQSFPRLGYQEVLERNVGSLISDADIAAAMNYWSPLTGVRQMRYDLIDFYLEMYAIEDHYAQLEILRRQSTDSLFSGLRGGLTFSPEVYLRGPTPIFPSSLLPQLDAPTLTQPGSEPMIEEPELIRPDFRPILETTLDDLLRPEKEIEMYMAAELVLPVRASGVATDVRLYFRRDLRSGVLTKWAASQWAPVAPGLNAISSGSWNAAASRRVAAVSETKDDATTEKFFAPDPRYHAHIQNT